MKAALRPRSNNTVDGVTDGDVDTSDDSGGARDGGSVGDSEIESDNAFESGQDGYFHPTRPASPFS